MESFWGKLKQEWLNEQHFHTREEAKAAVFEYIWIFYNRKRIHEANGYLTPEEYYQKHEKDLKAAELILSQNPHRHSRARKEYPASLNG